VRDIIMVEREKRGKLFVVFPEVRVHMETIVYLSARDSDNSANVTKSGLAHKWQRGLAAAPQVAHVAGQNHSVVRDPGQRRTICTLDRYLFHSNHNNADVFDDLCSPSISIA
jgi:hypothetical protein